MSMMESRTNLNSPCLDSVPQAENSNVPSSSQMESVAPNKTNSAEPFLAENQQAETKDASQPKPPDGGYGWFIVLGSFITHVIIGSLERSEGLFFLQFQAKYKQSAQLTAWPGSLVATIRMMFGSVAGAISNRYSVRTCTFFGSVILFLGLFLNSFAPNFYFLFLSHGVLQGFGMGLIYAPSLIIVGMYFDKRRGLAAGLSCSGVGAGTFVFIPLIQLVFEMYGMSGSFLILSAFSLHSALVAMLHRPLSLHYKFSGVDTSQRKPRECKSSDELNSFDLIDARQSDVTSKTDIERNHFKLDLSQSKAQDCRDCITSSFNICFPREDIRYVKQTKKKIYHFYLLKTVPFLLFCFAILTYTAGNKSSLTFIPALVKEKGFSDTEAAFILSIIGIFDTIGRMGTGALFDLSYLRPHRPLFYNLLLTMIAVFTFIFPTIDSYVGLCIFAAAFGCLAGAFISQKSVIIVDILGAQHMASSFGMLILFQGVGSGIGPPLSGLFRDLFGSFSEVFFLGGVMLILASTFMFFSNLLLRRQSQKSKPKQSK